MWRAQYEARIALMAPPAEIADVREQTIDGRAGRAVARPHIYAARQGAIPAVGVLSW
jgi:hypothetical protein